MYCEVSDVPQRPLLGASRKYLQVASLQGKALGAQGIYLHQESMSMSAASYRDYTHQGPPPQAENLSRELENLKKNILGGFLPPGSSLPL